MIRWKTGYDIPRILRLIEQIRTVKNGQVSYTSFQFEEFNALLRSALAHPSSLIPETARIIVSRTLGNPSVSLSNPDIVLSKINETYRAHLRRKKQTYYVYTTLSYTGEPLFNEINMYGVSIYFNKAERAFASSANERRTLMKTLAGMGVGEPKVPYRPVIIRTDGVTLDEAFHEGLQTLENIRGLLNYRINQRKGFRQSFGTKQPVNTLRLGPLHTIHDSNKDMLPGRYWFEPDFVSVNELYNFDKERNELRSFLVKLRRRLSNSPISTDALEAIRRYSAALDQTNWSASFRELWQALEFLTHTERSSYEKTISRIGNLFKDRDDAIQIARHLRDRRNKLVHVDPFDPEGEILMFQTKRIVEPLLGLYLMNIYRFESKEDIADFLDLPHSDKRLQRLKRLLRSAEQFRI